MSVYRTLKLRGLNPTKTMADALRTYVMTGRLPVLPGGAAGTEGRQHDPLPLIRHNGALRPRAG